MKWSFVVQTRAFYFVPNIMYSYPSFHLEICKQSLSFRSPCFSNVILKQELLWTNHWVSCTAGIGLISHPPAPYYRSLPSFQSYLFALNYLQSHIQSVGGMSNGFWLFPLGLFQYWKCSAMTLCRKLPDYYLWSISEIHTIWKRHWRRIYAYLYRYGAKNNQF